VFLHHVVPPLPFFVALCIVVVIIVSLATTNKDDTSVLLRDAIVSLVFLLLLRHFSTKALSREREILPPDSLRHTRAFIYIYICVVINKKRERIDDTNEREFSRLILFLRRRRHALFGLFGGGGGLSKSALSFHDKTHFCDDDF